MFGLSEHFGWHKKEINLPAEKEWRLSDLPQLPDERNKISRAESIFTIIFLVIGGALVSFALDLIRYLGYQSWCQCHHHTLLQ